MIAPRGLVSLSRGAEANRRIAMALGVIFSHDRTACWNASLQLLLACTSSLLVLPMT